MKPRVYLEPTIPRYDGAAEPRPPRKPDVAEADRPRMLEPGPAHPGHLHSDGSPSRGRVREEDDLILEVRRNREAYAQRFGFDLRAIHRDLKRQERESGRKVVSFESEAPERNPAVGPSRD